MLFPPWEEAEKASFKGDQPSPDSKSVVTLIMVSEASRTSVHRVMPLRTFSGGWKMAQSFRALAALAKHLGSVPTTPIRQLAHHL